MFENGNHNGVMTTEDTTWTFACDNDYSLSGLATITCGSNGEWSGSAPECSKHFVYFCLRNNH